MAKQLMAARQEPVFFASIGVNHFYCHYHFQFGGGMLGSNA
jgi:hypothetical protein